MAISLEHIAYCGEPAVLAQNDQLSIILVPGWGSNVIAMTAAAQQVELLRSPISAEAFWAAPILYGIPVLFPPNRIEDGMFAFNNRTYQFDINEPADNNHSHGLLFAERWELLRAERIDDALILETEVDSTRHPDVYRQFPHEFSVRMTYRLEGGSLYKDATITNHGRDAFPWGLGYHTTFNFPFMPGNNLGKCTLALPAASRQWQLNDRFLPTGQLLDIPYVKQLRAGKSLVGHPLDDVFQVEEGGANDAVLYDGNADLTVTYRCDGYFKQWVIYNDDAKQGYVCPEPYTWVTNAPNIRLPHALTGLQTLAPGQQVTIRTSIRISGKEGDRHGMAQPAMV